TIDGVPTAVFDGGLNEVALFAIDRHPSHPNRIGGFDVHGFEPRTFTIDPTQRFMIVANQKAMNVLGDDGKVHTVNPNLVVFRIEKDGSLVFLHSYDLGGETLWVDSARLGEAD
ncbi:MAG TPA: beta-propeller fold lactonase family protein, partial [Polyangia bacterium]|nr:beta-propeller fold lactonase family protein [Polyangia bacterium]